MQVPATRDLCLDSGRAMLHLQMEEPMTDAIEQGSLKDFLQSEVDKRETATSLEATKPQHRSKPAKPRLPEFVRSN